MTQASHEEYMLETVDFSAAGRAFKAPAGYMLGCGPTPGTVEAAIEGWAPGCHWIDNDSATAYTNTGTKTTAVWSLNANAASANTFAGVTSLTGGIQTPMISLTDANTTILAANSGKIHLIPNVSADRVYTIPPASAGLYYEFWSTLVAADGHDVQIIGDDAADFYKGMLMWLDTNGSTYYAVTPPNGSDDHTLNLILPIAFMIRMYCDGTNWFITGHVEADATPTWT